MERKKLFSGLRLERWLEEEVGEEVGRSPALTEEGHEETGKEEDVRRMYLPEKTKEIQSGWIQLRKHT